MHITSAEFVKGLKDSGNLSRQDEMIFETSKSHIAFVGRSNVGKSSLINSLVDRKDLAHSSSNPGKTREINFYLVNKKYYFVDLPGYGFAKVSKQEQESIRQLILWYLFDLQIEQRKVVLIVDAKVGPTEFDSAVRDELGKAGIPMVIAANKIDKVKKSELDLRLEVIRSWAQGFIVVPYSTKTKEWRGELWKEIA